jgi:hypothetical protein
MQEQRTPVVIPAKRLVPGPGVTLNDFLTATDDYDWRLVGGTLAQPGIPEEHILQTPDEQSTIHWIKDLRIGVNYIAITGEHRDELAQQLRKVLPIYTDEEIHREPISAVSIHDHMKAIYHLALIAPDECDEGILKLFEKYLRDPERKIRVAAVISISYIGWLEFLHLLQPIAANEPDEVLRQDAATLIQNLQKSPPRSVLPQR